MKGILFTNDFISIVVIYEVVIFIILIYKNPHKKPQFFGVRPAKVLELRAVI